MASISEPLLGAGAQAKNDWAKAEAATSLTFTGEAQFRRGIEVEIGLNALASADAGLSKFVDATVRGNAFAEATASFRLQLPLNLFDDFGLAIGAQAVAQAAAGIEAGLGLSVGDFIALLRRNGEGLGLPLDLAILLLDEAVVGGKFEVHVAAAAMAYASILITGRAVRDPGFHLTVEAGLGLAAGAGYGGSLDLGIRDFRRFYGRAVDLATNSVLDGVVRLLPDELEPLEPQIRALAPAAVIALRTAYEIGDYLAKNQPKQGHQDALDLSNHCVGIVLEEAQRFLFGRFLEAGLISLRRLVERDVPHLAAGAWNALMPQRRALADVLYRMPAEPFQLTDVNAAYWSELVAKATDLAAQLPAATSTNVFRGMAMVYSAAELLTEMIRSRVNTAQAYAFAVGAGRLASPPPRFDRPLARQPGERIRTHINGVLGHGVADRIDYVDLVAYLLNDTVVAALRAALPAVDEFLAIFRHPQVASNLADVLRALVRNREAFMANSSGDRDPQETLRVLLGVLDTFITIKINEELVPALRSRLTDANVRLYFEEVLIGTLVYTKNVTFQTVLDWEKHPVDRAAFTEALSGVMMMLLGRSLVLVGDGFVGALQADMKRACDHAAARLVGPHDPFKAIGIAASPELKALLTEVLRVGGEVFGPLPEATRRNLRLTLYDVMEALPPGAAEQAEFVENLADQFFIPNQELLGDLTDQLLAISRERFQLFVERVLEAGGDFVLNLIEDFISEAIRTVLAWLKELEDAIATLFAAIGELEQLIEELVAQAQQAFDQARQSLEALLERFSNQGLRARLRREIAKKMFRDAKGVLADIPLYRDLPREAKRVVKGMLEDVIEGLIEGPVLGPIFDALGAVAGELDGVLDDVRELNPNEPLAPQLLDLVIDRLEDRIRDAFGGTKPRVDVGFTVTVLGLSKRFSLGNIDLPFNKLFTILRDAITGLDFYEAQLGSAVAALAEAFRKSVDLQAKQDLHDRTKADHDRLSRIRSEFSPEPKTITVISPVQSLAYDDDVEVRIHLGDVSRSYLGLDKDEQQRVLVFLNGELMPARSLAIEDSTAFDAGASPGRLDTTRPSVDDLGRTRIVGRARTGSPRSGSGVARPGMASGHWLPLQPSLRSLAAGRGAVSSRPVARQSVKQAAGGGSVVTTVVANVLPGRRMTAAKRASLEQPLSSGIVVGFRADRGDLVTGTNTLVVVVIDPGGQRYQQLVSFAVTGSAAAANDAVRLPVATGRKSVRDPAVSPGGIDLHLQPKAVGNRLKPGRDSFVRNSALHLQGFRRN